MLRGVTRTQRQRRGAASEELAADYLARLGWELVRRNVRVGHDEIDILALDPGPPMTLVAVEVRSVSTVAFGAPEEHVDRAKAGHLYRALFAAGPILAELHPEVRRLPRRVDLLAVDRRGGTVAVRHLRGLEPPA